MNFSSLQVEALARISADNYDYPLPEQRIPAFPLENREESKLLISSGESITETYFARLPEFIPAGSMLVMNDTKVFRARLIFQRPTGSKVEVFCLEPVDPPEMNMAFSSVGSVIWRCLVGNGKKWKGGRLQAPIVSSNGAFSLAAELVEKEKDSALIRFTWDNPAMSFANVLEEAGKIPLPPYIRRETTASDAIRYQTVYSRLPGSVAAPTAGLHFTEPLLGELRNRGVIPLEITLHVGAGTFQPVKAEWVWDHAMHSERFQVTKAALEDLSRPVENRIAVGTTTLRAMESLYWIGTKLYKCPETGSDQLFLDQWEAYSLSGNLSFYDALDAILSWMNRNQLEVLECATRLMIVPGFSFRAFQGLITNFHQPRSTLLMLVHAFAGQRVTDIYRYALDHDFRFLSYGDSSLIWKNPETPVALDQRFSLF